jgi:hypothetical protein
MKAESRTDQIRVLRTFGGKYGRLLIALIALLVSAPLIVEGRGWNLLLSLLATSVLITSLQAAKPGRRSLFVGLLLSAVDLGISGLAAHYGREWMLLLQIALWLSTMVYVAVTILEWMLARTLVTIDTLQAAVCVYLLLGLIWVFVYAFLDLVAPGEFQFSRGPNFRWTDVHARRMEFMRLLFFSYSTLSMVGGGGVATAGWFARMCACLEAMSGQIYLAVLIARLVGIHVVQNPSESTGPSGDRGADERMTRE